MSCCGQKRAEASQPARSRPVAGPPGASSAYAGFAAVTNIGNDMVEIEYVEQSPVVVRGPATGATYQFSAAAPIQRVYREDLNAMLATRYFRLAARTR